VRHWKRNYNIKHCDVSSNTYHLHPKVCKKMSPDIAKISLKNRIALGLEPLQINKTSINISNIPLSLGRNGWPSSNQWDVRKIWWKNFGNECPPLGKPPFFSGFVTVFLRVEAAMLWAWEESQKHSWSADSEPQCCATVSQSQQLPVDRLLTMREQKSSITLHIFSSVQSLSRVRLFATPWITARQASLSITNSQNSPRFMPIESVMPSGHLILCRPLLLLPPIPPSIRVFSNESTLHMRWPKYWSFSFSHHSFQRNPRADLLQNGLVGSPCSPGDSQESSPTP